MEIRDEKKMNSNFNFSVLIVHGKLVLPIKEINGETAMTPESYLCVMFLCADHHLIRIRE